LTGKKDKKKKESKPSALNITPGAEGGHDGMPQKDDVDSKSGLKKRSLKVDQYIEGIRNGDRTVIGRAVTLVESNAIEDQKKAQEVLARLMLHDRVGSIRIGISGAPGSGKSTFIEALGSRLAEKDHKIAVLAVDPSSSLSKGSILGDKTRMEKLGRFDNVFIRPSPAGGALGGVSRKTRETILIFEAAGYDLLFVETVGVGQSEITVRSMTDFFLLLLSPHSGDELQGVKRGIMEIADLVVVNKSDGKSKELAQATKGAYANALHYLQPATDGWKSEAVAASALTGEGLDEVWRIVEEFIASSSISGAFVERRRQQTKEWLHSMIQERVMCIFQQNAKVRKLLVEVENDVMNSKTPVTDGAWRIMDAFEELLRS